MVDPFDNPTLHTGEADNHAISTDHSHMKALGLSVFTTGNLYNWYNTKDEKGVYSNQALINYASIDQMFGTDTVQSSDGWGEWYGWRKNLTTTGNYKIQKWNDWSWTWPFLIAPYTQDDLRYDLFEGVTNGGFAIDFVHDDPASAPDALKFDTAYSPFPGDDIDKSALALAALNPILSIIQMNRWMNSFKRMFPKQDWRFSAENLTGKNLHAIDMFLTDIKGSKFSHIPFSGLVPFNVNLADSGVTCIKSEWVTYKLHLYDDFNPRVATNFAILKNSHLGGVKKDATGRTYASSVDGEYSDADPANPSHGTVGPLERSWNSVTKKWESGTANMMGVVDTPGGKIDAAYNNPTVESLLHSDIGLDLDGDADKHFAPSSGYVMPIHQQNSNPAQWQPNYAQSSGCRFGEDKNEKAKVIGFNFNPLKEYPHGSLVMLSKIGSIWHITDMGSGIVKDGQGVVTAGFEGQWEFQYLATNSINFFSAREKYEYCFWILADEYCFILERDTTKVDPSRVERGFHKQYYKGDTFNGQYWDPDMGIGGEWVMGERFNDQFSTIGISPIISRDGWWQFSSFDFMDAQICGTRKWNSLGTTQATLDAADRTIPLEQYHRNPAHSGPFFGCVFPDGYRVNSQLTEYWATARPFNIRKAVPKLPASDLAIAASLAFNTSYQYNNKSNPFLDKSQTWEYRDDGTADLYIPPRSDCTAAVLNPDPAAEFADGEDTYARTNYPGPSMFFMESEKGSQNLKQLPADIGTLSSPFAGTPEIKNGGPFRNIHAFDQFHKDGVTGLDLHQVAVDAFYACSWLCKVDLNNPGVFNANDSAFDFTPKRPNTIQFRPLKIETFVQFFPWYPSHGGVPSYFFPANSGRSTWSSEGRRQMLSLGKPASNMSIKRNVESAKAGGAYAFSSVWSDTTSVFGWPKNSGLHFNVDIARWVAVQTGKSAADIGMFPSYQGRIHNVHYWDPRHLPPGVFDSPWMNCPEDWESYVAGGPCMDGAFQGANAYGIIGAVATISANNSITFTTEQQIGMGSESWSKSVRISHAVGGASTLGRWYQRPSWGGAGCSYNTNRTTELHATIYQAWPRTQTLFDSRYFSVHHFNEYPQFLGVTPERTGIEFINHAGGKTTYGIQTRWPGGVVNQLDVDMRVPSAFQLATTSPQYPLVLGPNTTVWSDSHVSAGTVGGKVMPSKFWDIDVTRVGKLLPYKYVRSTLGVPWVSGAEFPIIGGNTELAALIPDDTPVTDLENKFILVSTGSGYQIGDIIGNKDFGVMASVMLVGTLSIPAIGLHEGNIITIKVFDVGKDIPTDRCFPITEIVDKDIKGGISIGNVATNGNGFAGFFVNSLVHSTSAIDHKPLFVDGADGRIFRVSAPADQTLAKDGTGVSESQFGFVKTPTTMTVAIEEEYKSPNGKYDVFFHFHNDITHTWGNNHQDYTDGLNPFENDEQYIQTSITSI